MSQSKVDLKSPKVRQFIIRESSKMRSGETRTIKYKNLTIKLYRCKSEYK